MIAVLVPLLADWTDGLKLVGLIIVALIYVFNYFVGNNKAQQRKPQRPDLRPRQPGAPAGRQEVNDEVAEFLRRTAERTSGKKPASQAPQPPARRPLVEGRLSSLPSSAEIVEVEAIEEPPTGAGVAAHVRQHLDPRLLGDEAGRMTGAEKEARQFEAHLHQAFDHQVGHLARRSAEAGAGEEAPAESADMAAAIAGLLAEPQNLRSAIVLNEILQRPTERW